MFTVELDVLSRCAHFRTHKKVRERETAHQKRLFGVLQTNHFSHVEHKFHFSFFVFFFRVKLISVFDMVTWKIVPIERQQCKYSEKNRVFLMEFSEATRHSYRLTSQQYSGMLSTLCSQYLCCTNTRKAKKKSSLKPSSSSLSSASAIIEGKIMTHTHMRTTTGEKANENRKKENEMLMLCTRYVDMKIAKGKKKAFRIQNEFARNDNEKSRRVLHSRPTSIR